MQTKVDIKKQYAKAFEFLVNSNNQPTNASSEFYLAKKVTEPHGTAVSLTAKFIADLLIGKPAYLHFVYVPTDRQSILTVDNQYIYIAKAGNPPIVFTELSCTQPFGSERIFFIVRTAGLGNIPFVIQNGAKAITIHSNSAIAAGRFKQEIEHLEKNIPITTVSKK